MSDTAPLTLPANPVLGYDDWSIKDACLAERDGVFHVFFSAFDEERSFVAKVHTADFVTYSDFDFWLDGRDAGHIGYCSPDVTHGEGRYVCVFNSWGDNASNPNRLFYIESSDLIAWSEPKPLAHDLYAGIRVIDGALTWLNQRWHLCYKLTGKRRELRIAWADSLDGPWHLYADEPVALLMADGQPNGLVHENAQLLQIDGVPHILTTDYKPHAPYLYRMLGDPAAAASWLAFGEGRELHVPDESWNTVDRCNAAAMLDRRDADGHLYLVYAGKDESRADGFVGAAGVKPWPRGWNKLGLARSRDGVAWETAAPPSRGSSQRTD